MTERSEMEAALEAILFVSSEPVPRIKLLELFDEDERAEAAEALEAVLARYADTEFRGDRGVLVEDVAGTPRATGLLYAGSSTTAIANPIAEVLNYVGSMLGGIATMVGN